MKKIYKSFLGLVLSIGVITSAQAQTGNFGANYTYQPSAGVYTDLTSPTILTSGAGMDEAVSVVTLSAPLAINGLTYTSVFVSENGWVSFGGTNPGTNYAILSSATANFAIAAFSRDNGGIDGTSQMSWADLPSEVVFQWKNIKRFASSPGEILNFQIRIDKTTGVISIVYGNCVLASGSSTTYPQVGIRSAATTWANHVNNLTIVSTTGNCDWAYATAGTSNTSTMYFNFANTAVSPANGLTYVFTPGTLTPPVRTIAAVSAISSASVTLNYTQPLGTPTAYNVQYRVNNTCAWTNAVGNPFPVAASIALTGLASSTTYQYRIQSVFASGNAIYSHMPATFATTAPICAGTPTPGIANSSATTICTPSNVNLTLTGATIATGITYQWLSSNDNITFTPIALATLATRTQSVIANTFYACQLACGVSTSTSTSVQVIIAATTTNTIPYFEGFEGISTAGVLPNCSWLRTGDWTTNVGTQSNNRIPKTGTKYAHTSWSTIAGGDIMYTNGLQLTAGTMYYASVDYITDGTAGFDELTMLIGPNQSTVGATNITSALAITNSVYNNLANTFSVSTTGIYYLGIKVLAPTSNPWYLSIDDINVILAPTCSLTPVAGIITGTNNTNYGNVDTYTVTGSAGNIQWYKGPTAGGPWTAIASATATTQTITAVSSGTVFYTVITSGLACVSATATALQVIVNFPGDDVCNAIALPLGVTTTTYSLFGATAQPGEVYDNIEFFSAPSNSIWFTFVAPVSGYVSVQSPDFDTQLSVWSATNCANLVGQAAPTAPIGVTLIGSNDDDAGYVAHGGVLYSSYVEATCLTPGLTYYIQLDPYATNASAASVTRVLVKDLGNLVTASASKSVVCVGAASTLSATTNATSFTWNTGAITRSISVTPTVTTVYTVSVTINGCLGTSTVQVNVSIPTVTATASSASVCAGSPLTLTANSTETVYVWSSGATTMTTSVNPTVFSVYTTTVTDVNTCKATSSVSVGIFANPTVTATASSASVCPGSPLTLTANSTETVYAWSSGATTMTTSVNPTILTVYTTTVTDVNTCKGTSTVSVGVFASPTVTATASSASVCVGSPVTLTANSTETVYAWSSGPTTMTTSVNPTMLSVYTTTVTDANSCIGTSTISVGVYATPTISVNSGVICASGSFTINPSGANTYTISGGASIVNPAITTNYSVTGTSLDGCNAIPAVATVTVVSTLTVTISGPSTICSGTTLNLTGNGASTYSWSTGVVSNTISSSPIVNTTYSVIGTSGTCSNTAVVTVTVNATPTVSVTGGTICSGKSFTMVPSGASTYSYTGGSAVVTPTAITSYSVVGTSSLGCVSSNTAVSTVSVNANPTISVSASNTIICAGEETTLSAVASTSTYTWNTGATTASLSVSPTTTTNYTVNTSDANGCSGTANVNITVNACTGINEVTSALVSVYPNPNYGIVNIIIATALIQNSSLEIYDALGKLVVKQVLVNELNAINTSNLNNGMYTFKVLNNNNTVKVGKLIKQ